ncbi:MAG TPA: hypothetical protein VF220_04940, partial [Nitrososphaeraceae archaeon]
MPVSSKIHQLAKKIVGCFTFDLNKKISFIFISIIASIIIIDSTIVEFYSFSGVRTSSAVNVVIFIAFSIVFAFSGILLVTTVKTITSRTTYKLPKNLRNFHYIVFSTQIITIGLISITIFQIIAFNKYHILLLQVATYVSHVSALVFAIPLVFILVKWFKSRRNYIILLYIITFSLVSVNIVVSLTYYEKILLRSEAIEVRPHRISTYVISFYSTPADESLSTVYNVIFILSFLVIWIATMALLNQYKYRLGKIRYYALTIIPLIYFIFPFHTYFANLLSPFVLNSPIAVSVIYTILFSATKQVGAVLFSLSFLIASTVVPKDGVRKSLLISCIGMTILFSCIEITPLNYKVFPPYGFITEAFIPLGTFLLLVGIFTSAVNVSQDRELRTDFRKRAIAQLTLLRTIGIAQMEKELIKNYKFAEESGANLETTQDYSEENVKQIVHEVLEELKQKDFGKR